MSTRPKPRIAILHYTAPPAIGGVESTIAAHARLFADAGYPVKIIAGHGQPFDPRVPVQTIPLMDSRHARIRAINRKLNRGITPRDWSALTTALRRALARALADADVCIAHNILTLHKNLALTSALYDIVQADRRRVLAWCHDFAWTEPVYAGEVHAGRPWDLMRQAWSGVKYVVVSEARRQELAPLLGIAPETVAVVPPGIDPLEFFGVSATTARWATGDLDLLAAAPLLLLPARVTRRKNIALAIEIVAALCARGLAPKLVVMGPLGPHNPTNARYLKELRALRRKRQVEHAVIFLQEHTRVDNAARRDLYWLADALLFPSAREGFGIPILEAGLARLPIFCADISPFHESARAWAHYFALDAAPGAIAERIARALAHDPHYRLKQRVLREYAWSSIFRARIEPLIREG